MTDIVPILHNLTVLTTACLVLTAGVMGFGVWGVVVITRIEHQILREVAALRRER
jgi:hypothetical protein